MNTHNMRPPNYSLKAGHHKKNQRHNLPLKVQQMAEKKKYLKCDLF